MDQNTAVIIYTIIITGGAIITPIGIMALVHRLPWFRRRRYNQHRRK